MMFVHPTLREYAAGRYASKLGDKPLGDWIAEVRRDALWREPVLLAAGARAGLKVVNTLLDLYDPEDPAGGELKLAAQALVEMPDPPANLTSRVAERVAERLDTDIPAVVFGAAEAALGMAREMPEILAPVIGPLARHPQFATRVAAVRVLLECGPEYSDPDDVRGVIENLLEPNEGEHELPQRRNPFFVWRIQDRIAYLGAKQLLDTRPGAETDELVQRVISGGGLISAGTHMELVQYLLDRGYEEMVERVEGKRPYYLPKKFVSAEAMREAN